MVSPAGVGRGGISERSFWAIQVLVAQTGLELVCSGAGSPTARRIRTSGRRHSPTMGSLCEGTLFILFEVMVLKLKERLGITAEDMRANHTNLE